MAEMYRRRDHKLRQGKIRPDIYAAASLLIGADDDIVRPEHYLEIYQSLPHAHLLIIPGTTHGGLVSSSTFNPAAAHFFDEEFTRRESK